MKRVGDQNFRPRALASSAAGLVLAMAGAFGGWGELRLASAANAPAVLPPALARTIDFQREVRPLLEAKCFQCHGPEKQRSGFRLDSREAALKTGDAHAPNIRPGNSAESPLIQLVAGTFPDLKMPEKGDPLTPEQVGLLRAWIDQGALWPAPSGAAGAAGAAGASVEAAEVHWAFRPVVRPSVPALALASGRSKTAPNPID